MLFMIIERFKHGDVAVVGERFSRCGRMLPDGVSYHASWVDSARARCFQLMETKDVTLLQKWVADWADLVEFEIVPVVAGKETLEALKDRL